MEHHVNIRPIRTDQDHRAARSDAWKIPADLLVRPYKIETAA
jgi:hypothetical protein